MFCDIMAERKTGMLYWIFEELSGIFQDCLMRKPKSCRKFKAGQGKAICCICASGARRARIILARIVAAFFTQEAPSNILEI